MKTHLILLCTVFALCSPLTAETPTNIKLPPDLDAVTSLSNSTDLFLVWRTDHMKKMTPNNLATDMLTRLGLSSIYEPLLPSVTGNSGKVLGTDGTDKLWVSLSPLTVGTTAITGGTNGHVFINNSGILSDVATTGTDEVVRASGATLASPALNSPSLSAAVVTDALTVATGGLFGFSGNYFSQNDDNWLCLGPKALTSAASKTLTAANGSGTDSAGSPIILLPGRSTGTAAGGAFIVETSMPSSTGTAVNGSFIRTYVYAGATNLTESSATAFLNLDLANSKFCGAVLHVTLNADDGTNYQSKTSSLVVCAVNKAGTVTATVAETAGTTAASSGTLTCTYTVAIVGTVCVVKANAVSSLTQTTLAARWNMSTLNSDAGVSVTPY